MLFWNSAIVWLCKCAIVLFCNWAIVKFCDSAIVWFCDCGIVQLCYSSILQLCNSAILQLCQPLKVMKSSPHVFSSFFFVVSGLPSEELIRCKLGAEVPMLEVVDVEIQRADQRQQKVTGNWKFKILSQFIQPLIRSLRWSFKFLKGAFQPGAINSFLAKI